MSEMSVVVFTFEDKDGNTYRAAGAINVLQREGGHEAVYLHDPETPALELKLTGHTVVTDATFGDVVIGAGTGFRPERLYMNAPSAMQDKLIPEPTIQVHWGSGA